MRTESLAKPDRPVRDDYFGRARSVQRKAVDGASPSPADVGVHVDRALAGGGQPLPASTRAFMETRFAHDFSRVRVHTGPPAAEAAIRLQARAFTMGRDVIFGNGQYAPTTDAGERLLVHELTHVVQQAHFGSGVQAGSTLSHPEDRAEREANRIASGGAIDVHEAPSASISRQIPATAPGLSPPPAGPPAFNVFEDPSAATPAGAVVAFDKYLTLSASDQDSARRWSYGTGALQRALAALGPVKSADPKYEGAVHDILRWVEETETRKTTGKSDADMAKIQAGFIKTKGSSPPGWGGTSATRWSGLLPAAQTSWTARGNSAIAAIVSHAATAAPELKLTAATFELDFDAIDQISLGALATGGSVPGKTVKVGFEFAATVEVNPAYALSTVVHELFGHPMYDEKSGAPNYAGQLYKDAAAQVPSPLNIDRSGDESFNYWPSEIYSLMKEIPYWTAVTPADAKKSLALPGSTSNAATLNYDPRGAIERWLKDIQTNWEPSLVNGIVRGFYKRVANDASMKKVSVTELEKIIKKVFTAAAAIILK